MKGMVFDIQSYSIHDGPGIRSTVFLKGCPLRCQWCHNPESNAAHAQLMFHAHLCTGCGKCITACPSGAISMGSEGVSVTDRSRCTSCGACTKRMVCWQQAREISGHEMTTEEVIKKVNKDRLFIEESGGGVTCSGGEPLCQPEFVRDIFTRAHSLGMNTALETSSYVPWETMKRVLEETDYLLCDIKHMDSARHRELTGVPNEQILENICRAARETQCKIWIRLPMIRAVNDSTEEAAAIIEYLKPIAHRVDQVWILPYHTLGISKLEALEASTEVMSQMERPEQEHLEQIKELFTQAGFETHVS